MIYTTEFLKEVMPGNWRRIFSDNNDYIALREEGICEIIWYNGNVFDLSNYNYLQEMNKDIDTAIKWYKLHFKLKNFK